jgi:hypothetical protein
MNALYFKVQTLTIVINHYPVKKKNSHYMSKNNIIEKKQIIVTYKYIN